MANKLYEYMSPEQSGVQIMESKDGKDLFMKGLFIQGDVKNQNGRVYPKEEIAKACESVKERLAKGETVMGELDHPEELQINLDRVSHIITDLYCDDSNGLGKLKITDDGINKRDQLVIENFFSKKIPLCGVLGGGYNKNFDKLIELHSMLHKNCSEII